MQQEQKNQKSKYRCFFFFWTGLVLIGMIFLLCSSIRAQADQDARLEWVAGQRTDPVIVSSHEAFFQIKLIDPQERDPNRFGVEVWIDADEDGPDDDDERKSLTSTSNENLSVGRIYSTTLYFLEDKTIGSVADPDGNQCNELESFETTFRFCCKIDGNKVTDDDNIIPNSPTDPNNQLIVLNKNCDVDEDGINDLEEGADSLPESYCPDPNYAYRDKTLVAFRTPGGKIAMKIDKGRFRKVRIEAENDANRPEETISNLTFPYGFISFRIEGPKKGVNLEEVELRILFPTQITNYAEFCRYSLGAWRARIEYSVYDDSYVGGDTWRHEDFSGAPEWEKRSLMVKLTDNNPKHDSNDNYGVIDDPWGLGIPRESSGGGRCFLSYIIAF